MFRKILTILTVLSLLCGCTAALADEAKTIYASDFSNDNDGWYGRGAQCFRTTDATLKTTGRQSSSNSPARDFDLIEGGKYVISVEVRQDDLDSARFMISIAHTADGVESYKNIASGNVKKGEWTTIKGKYTAGAFDHSTLYIRTKGADSLDFEIRNFTVIAPEGEPEPKPTEPPIENRDSENVPSLKEIYADMFDFGVAAPKNAFSDPQKTRMIKEQFSILTPENELKPNSVLDVNASKKLVKESGDETQVAIHLNDAKPLLNFAKANGLKVHGHTMLWGKNAKEGQTPEAFFHEGYDTSKPLVSREIMLGRLENYIRSIFEATEADWPGVIVSWDVLNEAIDDGSNWLRNCIWTKVIGNDYPNKAFEYARKYAPQGTLLYYNDYNTAMAGKLGGIEKLLKSIMAEGNIDGYGFQMHHSITFPSIQQIQTAVDTIARLGIRLRVSELDVGISNNSASSLKKQAKYYAEVMKILVGHNEQFEAVQVWGLNDVMSWRSKDYPLLFDGNGTPKPAFWAVADPESVK